MTSGLRSAVPDPILRFLRATRRRWLRLWHRFTPRDLQRALEDVGVRPGDVVLVHSSFDAFLGFTGSAPDVVAVLKRAVGPEGALLMPTLPFTGSVEDYASHGPVFDVQRTPSRVGLLTEVFRRSRDVVRSRHPTHAVAAWGRDAASLIEGHETGGTPCGPSSPYGRLLERDGTMLFVGAELGAMTFYHHVEEIVEPRLPFAILTAEAVPLTVQDGAQRIQIRTRLHRRELAGRRDLRPIEAALRRSGLLREVHVGGVRILRVRAGDVVNAVESLLAGGVLCYVPA